MSLRDEIAEALSNAGYEPPHWEWEVWEHLADAVLAVIGSDATRQRIADGLSGWDDADAGEGIYNLDAWRDAADAVVRALTGDDGR